MKLKKTMRIALIASVILFLFGIAANAAYLVPWDSDDGGVCRVLPADGQGLALRVSPSGTDDFAAGFVAGDFAYGAGWGGTAGQIVGGLIPIYGQLADARDTAANVRNVWNDPTSGEAWMGLAMSGVAWIPGVGDAAKGTYKGGRRAVAITENVHPSTPVGRLGSPISVPSGSNRPTIINGRTYTGHALDRMQERGLTPTVIESAINKGSSIPSRGSTFIYRADGIKVIINEHGSVVTAMPQ